MSTFDIIAAYTAGEKTLEETNAALKAQGSGFFIDPNKNALTEAEIRSSTIGYYPDMANGWGLLDDGIAYLVKVQVRNGVLVDADMNGARARFVIAGRTYWVDGAKLTEKEPVYDKGSRAYAAPKHIDKSRHPEWAGQTIRQVTQHGTFDVTYNSRGRYEQSVRVVEK